MRASCSQISDAEAEQATGVGVAVLRTDGACRNCWHTTDLAEADTSQSRTSNISAASVYARPVVASGTRLWAGHTTRCLSILGVDVSDADPDVIKPLRDANGNVVLSSYVHPSEIRAWADAHPAESRFPLRLIASGFDRLWSANRKIKAPLGRAERYLSCAADMEQAVESAERRQLPAIISIAKSLATGLRPQCDQLAAQCLEAFQSQQTEKLRKARNNERQTRVAESSLKSLKRLVGNRIVPPSLAGRVATLNQFWMDQRALTVQASEGPHPESSRSIGPADILPTCWFRFDVVDKATGESWDLRVPSQSSEWAAEHLWRLGFMTGTPRPWTPKSDPLVRAAVSEYDAAKEDPDFAGFEFHAEGEVVRASRAVVSDPSRADELRSALDVEADPEDRHHLFQCLAMAIYRQDQCVSRSCLGVCWQWWAEMFEIRRRARLAGAASVLDVLAPAMDCAEFVLCEWLDETRDAERLATLNEVFEEFIN